MAFTHYSPITVNTGQVPSTQTDFPMLVSYTDDRLKTIANGGNVHNGNDIRPSSTAPSFTAMTYEKEFYDGAAGTWIGWVKVPSLADASVVYLFYGDAALTADGSSNTTWDSNYKAVYHLDEATGTNSTDSTSGGNTLTVTNSPVQSTGKIKGALSYNGSTQYSVASSAATIVDPSATDLTISAWINAGDFQQVSAVSPRVIFLNIDGNNAFSFILNQGSAPDGNPNSQSFTMSVKDGGTTVSKFTTATFSTATWYLVTLVYNTSTGTITIYVNGASEALGNQSVAFGIGTADNKLYLARRSDGNGPTTALLDEVRISNSIRSADWILTEYRNQFAPSTFATLGTEVALGSLSIPRQIKLQAVERASRY